MSVAADSERARARADAPDCKNCRSCCRRRFTSFDIITAVTPAESAFYAVALLLAGGVRAQNGARTATRADAASAADARR